MSTRKLKLLPPQRAATRVRAVIPPSDRQLRKRVREEPTERPRVEPAEPASKEHAWIERAMTHTEDLIDLISHFQSDAESFVWAHRATIDPDLEEEIEEAATQAGFELRDLTEAKHALQKRLKSE